jgi:3-deoxy-D-manno-octulosonic-acid transferase
MRGARLRALYTLLLRAALPLVLLRLWWRGRREPGYRSGLRERFGWYEAEEREAGAWIWVHAVSVGEARAAAPLVRALQQARPDHRIVMTCMTAAGRETLRQVYGETVHAVFLPYDLPGAVQRFIEHFRPRLGIIVETEMWPNLLAACARNGIPVILANARMSERSARGYASWESLTGPGFRRLAAVLAQSDADAARLRSLGAPRVTVSGNLKFDVPPDAALVHAGRAWRERVGRPVLLLASTREGEEKMLVEALPEWDGRLLVVVVPRHPQRFDEVGRWAQARRTQAEMPGPQVRIYLGDTMGQMAFYYAACDVAVIGGSFQPLGGQNLIEALSAGAPVVAGPHMFNFAEATRLAAQAGATVQTADAAHAIREALRLLEDAPSRERMAAAGRKLVEGHRGATQRHVDACLALLGASGG